MSRNEVRRLSVKFASRLQSAVSALDNGEPAVAIEHLERSKLLLALIERAIVAGAVALSVAGSAGCAVQAVSVESTQLEAAGVISPAPRRSYEADMGALLPSVPDADKGYTCATPYGRYSTEEPNVAVVTPVASAPDLYCIIGTPCTVVVGATDASPAFSLDGTCE